jgi:hypothetical protein
LDSAIEDIVIDIFPSENQVRFRLDSVDTKHCYFALVFNFQETLKLLKTLQNTKIPTLVPLNEFMCSHENVFKFVLRNLLSSDQNHKLRPNTHFYFGEFTCLHQYIDTWMELQSRMLTVASTIYNVLYEWCRGSSGSELSMNLIGPYTLMLRGNIAGFSFSSSQLFADCPIVLSWFPEDSFYQVLWTRLQSITGDFLYFLPFLAYDPKVWDFWKRWYFPLPSEEQWDSFQETHNEFITSNVWRYNSAVSLFFCYQFMEFITPEQLPCITRSLRNADGIIALVADLCKLQHQQNMRLENLVWLIDSIIVRENHSLWYEVWRMLGIDFNEVAASRDSILNLSSTEILAGQLFAFLLPFLKLPPSMNLGKLALFICALEYHRKDTTNYRIFLSLKQADNTNFIHLEVLNGPTCQVEFSRDHEKQLILLRIMNERLALYDIISRSIQYISYPEHITARCNSFTNNFIRAFLLEWFLSPCPVNDPWKTFCENKDIWMEWIGSTEQEDDIGLWEYIFEMNCQWKDFPVQVLWCMVGSSLVSDSSSPLILGIYLTGESYDSSVHLFFFGTDRVCTTPYRTLDTLFRDNSDEPFTFITDFDYVDYLDWESEGEQEISLQFPEVPVVAVRDLRRRIFERFFRGFPLHDAILHHLANTGLRYDNLFFVNCLLRDLEYLKAWNRRKNSGIPSATIEMIYNILRCYDKRRNGYSEPSVYSILYYLLWIFIEQQYIYYRVHDYRSHRSIQISSDSITAAPIAFENALLIPFDASNWANRPGGFYAKSVYWNFIVTEDFNRRQAISHLKAPTGDDIPNGFSLFADLLNSYNLEILRIFSVVKFYDKVLNVVSFTNQTEIDPQDLIMMNDFIVQGSKDYDNTIANNDQSLIRLIDQYVQFDDLIQLIPTCSPCFLEYIVLPVFLKFFSIPSLTQNGMDSRIVELPLVLQQQIVLYLVVEQIERFFKAILLHPISQETAHSKGTIMRLEGPFLRFKRIVMKYFGPRDSIY